MANQDFRDACAIAAMQALIALTNTAGRNVLATSAQAFDIADAMAAEREKRSITERARER